MDSTYDYYSEVAKKLGIFAKLSESFIYKHYREVLLVDSEL